MNLLAVLRDLPRRRGASTFVRRLVAALALVALCGADAEAVEGMLRDGAVHHEPSAVAAEHAVSGGHHGHEDGPLSDHSSHGAGHEHGTSADHCTHQHGTAALPPSHRPADRLGTDGSILPDVTGRPARVSATLFHPPRA